MNDYKHLMNIVNNVHNSIAQDVFPGGGILRCKTCEESIEITTSDCGYYLSHGWPKHCGCTMQFIKFAEDVQNATSRTDSHDDESLSSCV